MTAVAQSEIEELFRSHRRDVFRLAYSLLGNASEAEDVTQTTFLNALRALRQGTRPRRPHAWLLAIAHNVCRSQIRDRRRAPVLEELDEGSVPAPPVAEGPGATDLIAAMRALEPRQRAALVLHDTRGLSVDEVAHRMGTSTVAAQSLVARARATLREELEAAEEALECGAARNMLARPTVGHERRLLRAHLRSCTPCRQEARRVRARRYRSALGAIFVRFGTLVKLGGAGAAAISGAVAVGVVGGPRDLHAAPVRSGPAPQWSMPPSAASLRSHAPPAPQHRTISPRHHVVGLPVRSHPATPAPAVRSQPAPEPAPAPPKTSPTTAPAAAPAAQVPVDPRATLALPSLPALPADWVPTETTPVVTTPAVTTPTLPDVSPPSLPLP